MWLWNDREFALSRQVLMQGKIKLSHLTLLNQKSCFYRMLVYFESRSLGNKDKHKQLIIVFVPAELDNECTFAPRVACSGFTCTNSCQTAWMKRTLKFYAMFVTFCKQYSTEAGVVRTSGTFSNFDPSCAQGHACNTRSIHHTFNSLFV